MAGRHERYCRRRMASSRWSAGRGASRHIVESGMITIMKYHRAYKNIGNAACRADGMINIVAHSLFILDHSEDEITCAAARAWFGRVGQCNVGRAMARYGPSCRNEASEEKMRPDQRNASAERDPGALWRGRRGQW